MFSWGHRAGGNAVRLRNMKFEKETAKEQADHRNQAGFPDSIGSPFEPAEHLSCGVTLISTREAS